MRAPCRVECIRAEVLLTAGCWLQWLCLSAVRLVLLTGPQSQQLAPPPLELSLA